MQYFDFVLSLIRCASVNANAATMHQINRLANALAEDGHAEQAAKIRQITESKSVRDSLQGLLESTTDPDVARRLKDAIAAYDGPRLTRS